MNKLIQLVMSGGMAAFLQLVANTFLYLYYEELSYAYFTQILLLSVTLRPLLTLKFENSIFRVQDTLFVGYCLLLMAIIVVLLLMLLGTIQNNPMLIMCSCICLLSAINELAELVLIKLECLEKVILVRLLRPVSLLMLILIVSLLNLNASIFYIFIISYLPSLVIIVSFVHSRKLFPKRLSVVEFFKFASQEKYLSLYSVPAGMLYGGAQVLIYSAVLSNFSVEFSAMVGFATRILESFINVVVPNLRVFLLKYWVIKLAMLKRTFFLFLCVAAFVGTVQIYWADQEVLLIGMLYLAITRILVTLFNVYAYLRRQDFFVLADALVCYGVLSFFLKGNIETQWIYTGYLSSFVVCGLMLLWWEKFANAK
ncbi:hypothetical protein [Lentibacter algarum]|uniref:hypothetical protein n=1 Tax=Lentibacter algarum TaxID=576131 RepID=UPI0024916F71|nr:hypothetical protein [Lentibacter algarum]